MNTKERGEIREALADAKRKVEVATNKGHEIVKSRYQGWVEALEWVLMEV